METQWVSYGDFLMQAIPDFLGDSGDWRGRVQIMRKNGNRIQPFTILENTFKIEEEAIHGSLEYGRLLIDGLIPGHYLEMFRLVGGRLAAVWAFLFLEFVIRRINPRLGGKSMNAEWFRAEPPQRKERNREKKAGEMGNMVHGFSNVFVRNYTERLCGLFPFRVDNPFTK